MDDEIGDIELHPREYVCQYCNLVHWRGAPAACDRLEPWEHELINN